MRVFAIDPGVVNLGFVDAAVDCKTNECQVTDADVIDVRYLPHKTVALRHCCLCHTLQLSSYVHHFVQEYSLQSCDTVVIEQQPPCSAGYATQQLLQAYLCVAPVLIHTKSIHRVYGATNTDTYNERKAKSIAFAAPHLIHQQSFHDASRQHDIADAYCVLRAYLHTIASERAPTKAHVSRPDSFDEFISKFAYKPILQNTQSLQDTS